MTAPKTIAFVLYPGLTPLDVIGPLQVLSAVGDLARARGTEPAVVTTTVSATTEPMATDLPLRLVAARTYDEVPHPDVVVVPGGFAPTLAALGDPALREYLRSVDAQAEAMTSVCTGALLLAGAGLLEDRSATTHWSFHALLERLGARYEPQRWVADGKYVTAAGVSAGIDLALHLVAELVDEATARQVQLWIEYDPQPPHGRIDWSAVDRDAMTPQMTRLAAAVLADHPDLLARLTP